VDSSVGGKTGINSARGKNLIGAFHQPSLVLADTDLLATLPEREVRAGYAEIIKIAAARDAQFFEWLEANGADVLALQSAAVTEAVARSVALKAEIVAADERESGVRALLNFGHTFGHAAEAEAGYGDTLRHGEAVAWGLTAAARMAVALGKCRKEDAQRIEAHVRRSGLPASAAELPGGPYQAETILDRMRGDKKAEGGRMAFILPRRIGEAYIEKTLGEGPVLDFLRSEFATP
jgi:3-dehydroquinate synthase